MAEEPQGVRIGRTVRTLRGDRLMSQQELATRANVAVAGVVNLEAGRVAHPRRTTIEKLAGALGVRLEELIVVPRAVVPVLDFAVMSRATPEQRRAMLGAATDAQVGVYVCSIDRALDQAERWGREEQDREALAAYKAFLLDLRAETDPFDLLPPSREQRAALVGHASVGAGA